MNDDRTHAIIGPAVTMSSREIAALTGKRHDNVLRDITAKLSTVEDSSILRSLAIAEAYEPDGNGIPRRIYRLDRRASLWLVTGYDDVARLKIIDRWQELEQQARFDPACLSREAILVLALEAERERLRLAAENQQLTERLERDRPAVEFHDEVAVGEAEFLLRVAAKTLFNGARGAEARLVQWLLDHRWLTRTGKAREATAYAIQRGYMRQRIDVVRGRAYSVAVVTAQGLVLLRHLSRSGELFTARIDAAQLLPAARDDAAPED